VARGQKDFGTLEVGKFGDLVILTADPLADIHNIQKIATVMKGGTVVDRAQLPAMRVLSVAK
jgi:imidazolonepropionase-like amidohydrolase